MNPNANNWLTDVLAVPFKATKHVHSHQDEVYRIETESVNYYLKISRSLRAERDNLKKLSTILSVPEVIDFYVAEDNDYLLISESPEVPIPDELFLKKYGPVAMTPKIEKALSYRHTNN